MTIKNKNTAWRQSREGLQLPRYATGDLPTPSVIDGLDGTESHIAYDTTTNTVKYCDGTSWANIDGSAAAGTADAVYNAGAWSVTVDANDVAFTLATAYNMLIKAAAAGTTVVGLEINDNTTGTFTDGLLFTAANSIVDAVDASAANIDNAINIGANAIAGTNFNVTGAGAVVCNSLTGPASATFAIAAGATGQDLTLNGNGTGKVVIGKTSTGDVEIGDAGNTNVVITSGTSIGLTSATVTVTGDLTVTGTATIGSFNISAVQPASGNLTLNGATGATTITIGNLSTGGIIISDNMSVGAPVVMSSTNDISFNASTEKVWSSAAGQLDLAAATELQIATPTVDINAATAFQVDGANFSIDATATSNVSVTGGNLQLYTITTGDIDMNVADNLTIDSGGTFSIDGVGASNVTTVSGDLELKTGTSGVVILDGFSEVQIEINNIDEMRYTTGAMAFQQATTISTTATTLTLSPSTDVVVANGKGLIIGAAAQVTTSALNELEVLGTAAADSQMTIGQWSAAATGGAIDFVKSRNATIGSATIVQDNDVLGTLRWNADDGVDFATVPASIHAEVDDGTPVADSIGGALVFATAIGTGADDLTERLRITAAGDVTIADASGLIVGNPTGITTDVLAEFQILGTAPTDSSMTIGAFSADAVGGEIGFLKSRHATLGSNTIVNDNDVLGSIVWYAADGGDFATPGASIFARVNGTPGANDMPTELVFAVTADAGNTVTEAVNITADGVTHCLGGVAVPTGKTIAMTDADSITQNAIKVSSYKYLSVPLSAVTNSTSTSAILAVQTGITIDAISVAFVTCPSSAGGNVTLNVYNTDQTGGPADDQLLQAADLVLDAIGNKVVSDLALTATGGDLVLSDSDFVWATVTSPADGVTGVGGVITIKYHIT